MLRLVLAHLALASGYTLHQPDLHTVRTLRISSQLVALYSSVDNR